MHQWWYSFIIGTWQRVWHNTYQLATKRMCVLPMIIVFKVIIGRKSVYIYCILFVRTQTNFNRNEQFKIGLRWLISFDLTHSTHSWTSKQIHQPSSYEKKEWMNESNQSINQSIINQSIVLLADAFYSTVLGKKSYRKHMLPFSFKIQILKVMIE